MRIDLSLPDRRLALRWLCVLAAGAIVFELFYMGMRPAAAGLITAPWDKVAHFAVYATVAALLWTAAGGRRPLAVLAVVVAIGAFDELHQAGVPGRTADAMDFLADTCAVTATLGLLRAWKSRRTTDNPTEDRKCAA